MFNEKVREVERLDGALHNLRNDLEIELSYDGTKGTDASAASAIDSALGSVITLQENEIARLDGVMRENRHDNPNQPVKPLLGESEGDGD
jgi:hypothetical protein